MQFFFDIHSLDMRLTFVVTNFLAAFAMFFVLTADLPKQGTLTTVDAAMLVTIFTITLVGPSGTTTTLG